jgi:hypothetical protein
VELLQVLKVTLGLVLALTSCHSIDGPATPPPDTVQPWTASSAPQLLDDHHADQFRAAFNDARDRNRYVVALSPT